MSSSGKRESSLEVARRRLLAAISKNVERTEPSDGWDLAALGARDGLWHWDLVRNRVVFSPRWKTMLGLDADEIGERPAEWLSRIHEEDRVAFRATLDLHLEGQTPHFEAEYRIASQLGDWRWVLCRGIAERDRQGRAVKVAGSQTDVTEQKLAVVDLLYRASHDLLTGLPNRLLFIDRVEHAIERVRRSSGRDLAVMFVDIDRFKLVNDTWGHEVGDEVLVEVSHRLQRCLRPGDTIARVGETVAARLGGDEFTLLLEDIHDVSDAIRVAERILEAFAEPIRVRGREIEVVLTASIGVAVGSVGYERAEDLVRDADAAMYRAKKLGKARYEVCNPEMHRRTIDLVRLENDLRGARAKGELCLVYQPLVELETGRLAGFEALVRWLHPERGLVLPDEFIRVAEDTGLIVDIGSWVFREACRQFAEWNRAFRSSRDIVMSVNVSGRQLGQQGFVEELIATIRELGVDPSRIKLEITESAIIRNLDAAVETLRRLEAFDIELSIDDFGTGYSSFSYLHRFPISVLKIDQSFIRTLEDEEESRRIVEMMIPLADVLGVRAVAEGIETEGQLRILRSLGCAYGQGFHFAAPLDVEAVESLLREEKVWAPPDNDDSRANGRPA